MCHLAFYLLAGLAAGVLVVLGAVVALFVAAGTAALAGPRTARLPVRESQGTQKLPAGARQLPA